MYKHRYHQIINVSFKVLLIKYTGMNTSMFTTGFRLSGIMDGIIGKSKGRKLTRM